MKSKFLLMITAAVALLALVYANRAIAGAGTGGGAPADTAGAGEVTGVVKFDGPAPVMKSISMAKEPECMKMHPGGAKSEEAIIGSDGTVSNVIVYVSEGLGDRTFDPPANPLVIEQKGCTYRPHVLAMQANQKIQILNSDPTSHNIHPMPVNNREWNKSQPSGQPPIEATFAREEIAIPVKCNEHPWMRAYVAVFKHPFFVVTGKDGRFELKNLPPGEYTISAWHEKFGTVEQKVAVGDKETKTLAFVFKARPSYGGASSQ
jgi:plastocyanin